MADPKLVKARLEDLALHFGLVIGEGPKAEARRLMSERDDGRREGGL